METSEEIKDIVKEKYGKIAAGESSCGCGCGCGPAQNTELKVYNIMTDSYSGKDGYFAEADLGLGCGIPTDYAGIKPGNIVLDLGSGAGNDVFIAAREVSAEGKVIGVDMTREMIEKAEINKAKLGASNVEFRYGEIENLPVDDSSVDVVISNCVLNLVPDKNKAFSEIFRVIRDGGHFCVSDIVIEGTLPPAVKRSAELYAGCIAGASTKDEYLGIIKETGFKDVKIVKQKLVEIPKSLENFVMTPEEITEFNQSGAKVLSITVNGYK